MIGIIGAGISGLSLAWHLSKAGKAYMLLEASDHPGGLIRTKKAGDCILEQGPNSILCDQEILDFLNEVGLQDEMIEAATVSKSRYIYRNGRYRQLPGNPLQLLTTGFLSASAKLSIMKEFLLRSEGKRIETLAEFIERRFNKEICDYVLNPFVSGIFSGDPAQLLVEETFPQLLEYEKKYGSVLKGLSKNASRKKSLSFRKGMQRLPEKIAEKLYIRYRCQVTGIRKNGNDYLVLAKENDSERVFRFSGIVLAAPAFTCAEIIRNLHPDFSEALSLIRYPPMAAVYTVYPKNSVKHALNGFGGLNPGIENRFAAGSIWSTSVFPDRCAPGQVLFTTFVGGEQKRAHALKQNEAIMQEVHNELSKDYNISSHPLFQEIVKWEKSIPQYDKAIPEVRKIIPLLEQEGIYCCANWLGGVSLAECIKKGKALAQRI